MPHPPYPPAPTLGIIGLGLIGGSLGLDLRRQGYRVLGVSRRDRTCELATTQGAVDQASTDFALMAEADWVVLCTPLDVLVPTVEALRPHLRSGTVLTDVGSVKQPIVEAIAPLWPNFVGGHPMAGTTDQGIEAAQFGLFVDRPYVLTPTPQTPAGAIAAVEALATALGARLYRCSPEEHDRSVAWISHLPVMVSTSLIQACRLEPSERVCALAQQLASSGFRDTSRVGGGNSELGLLMARYNREALLQSLRAYRQSLDGVMAAVEGEDWPQLQQILEQSHGDRPRFVA
ncbi:MAG: prephenate/arogenate dehydrogenase [Synechococcales cyanobacterium CRU_2_2]|nr:prephenate/arogenate dehydrogenase [Synechococcales cyanobacterium CRU_2_2]